MYTSPVVATRREETRVLSLTLPPLDDTWREASYLLWLLWFDQRGEFASAPMTAPPVALSPWSWLHR